jgi:O-antigen ligase
MYLFGFLSSLFLYIKNFKKYLAVFILFFLLIFYSIYRIQNINFGFSSIDRFLLEDYQEDAYTVTSRIDRWFQSVDIGVSHILSGVGLGNYSLYISNKEKQGIFLNVSSKKEFISASQDPHNIFFSTFAETGAVGLISFLVMLLYFFKKDIRILLLENHKFTKSLIIAFWTLFLYGIFNPTSMIKYQVDFFLMRFLIEFLYSKNSKLLSI